LNFVKGIENLISFIFHSGYFYSASSSPLLLRGAPDYSTDTLSEFSDERHRIYQWAITPQHWYCVGVNTPEARSDIHTTESEGLTQGSSVVARVGFTPATLRTQGTMPHICT